MDWIKCSDRLPRIQEEIEVTDGHRKYIAWVWDHVEGGVYFEYTDESPADFIPIWWRPLDRKCALYLAFFQNTFQPRYPKEEV